MYVLYMNKLDLALNKLKWFDFGLVSLFNSISYRLFNANAILLEEHYYLTHSWEDNGGGSYLSQGYFARK